MFFSVVVLFRGLNFLLSHHTFRSSIGILRSSFSFGVSICSFMDSWTVPPIYLTLFIVVIVISSWSSSFSLPSVLSSVGGIFMTIIYISFVHLDVESVFRYLFLDFFVVPNHLYLGYISGQF